MGVGIKDFPALYAMTFKNWVAGDELRFCTQCAHASTNIETVYDDKVKAQVS